MCRLAAFTFALALAATANAQAPEARCNALASLSLDHAEVTSADLIDPAAKATAPNLPGPIDKSVPPFCRVRIEDHPSSDSAIQTEVWLPVSDWNGKLRGEGNGGFAGEIYYSSMALAVTHGYATVGTDTGHVGHQPAFALGHPEKVKDFGWRAIHDMTVEAKEVVAAFYSEPLQHAYFTSCSDGGREALMEAQRFSTDYDGILAGAPAYNWTALLSSGTKDEAQMHATPAANIPVAKLPAIAAAVRAACDAKDGVTDGILSDPTHCGFDPATLVCKQGDSETCLQPQQAAALKQFYTTKRDAHGKKIFSGFLPGSEDDPNAWGRWVLGDQAFMLFYGNGYFSNFIYQPGWTMQSFDFARDYKAAVAKTSQALDANDPNLAPFLAHGGRLVLYHGWADPGIPALSTVDYYNAVVRSLGAQRTQAAVRLYLAPGMLHCAGGPGPNNFGQSDAVAASHDPEHDIFNALEQWVEQGTAPSAIIATKFTDDDPAKPTLMARPLCPYPQVQHYVSGDPNTPTSFTCAAPAR